MGLLLGPRARGLAPQQCLVRSRSTWWIARLCGHPIAIMVDKGWQLQNTIPDELFNTETQELTRAGELKVQWILTQMPARRRAVFVLRGSTPDITATRVKSVEKAAAGVVGGASTLISVTDVIPRDGSASYYERVNISYESSIPPPRLPAMRWKPATAAAAASGGG